MSTLPTARYCLVIAAFLLLAVLPPAARAQSPVGPLLVTDRVIATQGGRAAVAFQPVLDDTIPLGYLVVWSQPAVGGTDVWGQVLTATGDDYVGPFPIAVHPGIQDDPLVASDGSRYLVAWHDRSTGAIVGRVVYATGMLAPSGEFVLANGAGRAALASNNVGGPGPVRDPQRIFLVFETSEINPGSQGDILGRLFTVGLSGIVSAGPTVQVRHTPAHETAPSVAFGRDRFLVTWNTQPSPGDDAQLDVVGTVLSDDGSMSLGDVVISTAPGPQWNTSGTGAADGTHFIVAWEDGRAAGPAVDIVAARVTIDAPHLVDGPPAGGGIPVLAGLDGAPRGVAVARVADAWLIAGIAEQPIAARVLPTGVVADPAGVPITARTVAARTPSIATDGTNALVAWTKDDGSLRAQIVGRRSESVTELAGAVEDLVGAGRLSPLDGTRILNRLASAARVSKPWALDQVLEKTEWLVRTLYLPTGRISIGDAASLILQARWLRQGPPAAPPTLADLGNPTAEAQHHLEGWGEINGGLLPEGIDSDRTSRYQRLRGSNSVVLGVPQPGALHALSFRTEDGVCDDSFEVYVDDHGPVYAYRADPASYVFPRHEVVLDGRWLANPSVRITFVNTARDTCGLAATYFVRLTR